MLQDKECVQLPACPNCPASPAVYRLFMVRVNASGYAPTPEATVRSVIERVAFAEKGSYEQPVVTLPLNSPEVPVGLLLPTSAWTLRAVPAKHANNAEVLKNKAHSFRKTLSA